jgi:leader peptidase (prepilin peptidase)/N-methyltransferase
MGEGDAKLLLMVGAFLGWQGVLFALVAGSLQGLVVYFGSLLTGRRIGPAEAVATEPDDGEAEAEDEGAPERSAPMIPFGPFLALGALEFLFFGPQLVDWYFGLLAA